MSRLSSRKLDQAAAHYAKIMDILGFDPKNEHSKDTPLRVIRMLEEMTGGMGSQPECNIPLFANKGDQLVVVNDIPFASMCAHHHAPFIGTAAVGYLPTKYITGISKFKRIIDHFSARPQTQEDLVNEVADFLNSKLKPRAVFVYMKAAHTCMGARGVRTPCSDTITTTVRGPDSLLPHLKSEFYELLRK